MLGYWSLATNPSLGTAGLVCGSLAKSPNREPNRPNVHYGSLAGG